MPRSRPAARRRARAAGGPLARAQPATTARRVGVDRADAVDRGADPRAGPVGERVDALRPGVGVAVGEAPLDLVGRRADPAVQVARVEQRDPDARLRGGVDQRLAHLVRVVVGLTAGAVVQVVELADRGDPGQRHLGERRARERAVAVGIEPAASSYIRSRQVQKLPPAPLGAPAQRAMEGVEWAFASPGSVRPASRVGARRAAPRRRRRPRRSGRRRQRRRPRPRRRSPPSQASSHQ